MNKAYLLTGGNLGNREANLRQAKALLNSQCGKVSAVSSLYETEPWGKADQPAFINQALELNTTLNAKQLIRRVLKIEKQMGRQRKEKYGPRIIDIDILLFNDEVINIPFLTVPHPEMQNRMFALKPLAEIAGNIIHPVLKKTVHQLLKVCPDKLKVKKLTD